MGRDGSTISWGKVSSSVNGSNSLTFMEIRLRSIGKALAEIKNKRLNLEQELRLGHMPESEYASSLLKLIVECNSLTKEKEEVAEKVKTLKNRGLVQR
ncbi:MAG: hypothetical protein ACFFCP_05365 [Promethearchaeota archaeon]